MFKEAIQQIQDAKSIIIIQAENPDGDSVGTSLALEEILGDIGKKVSLYCPVDIPKYLRYIKGWDRITSEFNTKAELAIVVDTIADVLLTKVYETPGALSFLESHPVIVIDHHTTEQNLRFNHTLVTSEAVATSEVVYDLAQQAGWGINQQSAENLMVALMSDSLGLTTQAVSAKTYFVAGKLAELGASNATIEDRRREFMKKSPEILAYKGRLIERIEYLLEGDLALIHIPWEEIEEFSDQYNPSMLVLDEMRLVENVKIAVAIKTYPDGKLTGKLRTNIPIAEQVASYFGGGGHDFAAGFRVYEQYEKILPELTTAVDKAIKNYDSSLS